MNDKLNMVVVGLRFGGEVIRRDYLNPTVAEPGIRLAGVCDLDKEKAQAFGAEFNLKVYASLDEVLGDPEIDAVGLFTGPAGRADLIRKIIRAGKHVMTTKPFELDSAAALDVLKEARALKKIVHLNSPGPHPDAETEQALRWVREYDLGKPVSILWETYANYFDKADGSWYDDFEKCPLAPIFRLGIYGLNQIISLFGNVEQVNVVSSRIRTGRPTPDNAMLSLRFKNGALGLVHASFCVKNGTLYPGNLTLNYERGTIRTAPIETDSYGATCARQMTLQMAAAGGGTTVKQVRFGLEDLTGKYQWHNFHKAVKSGAPLQDETTPEQIVAALQVINAMAEAEKTGGNVKIRDLITQE